MSSKSYCDCCTKETLYSTFMTLDFDVYRSASSMRGRHNKNKELCETCYESVMGSAVNVFHELIAKYNFHKLEPK